MKRYVVVVYCVESQSWVQLAGPYSRITDAIKWLSNNRNRFPDQRLKVDTVRS